ncbi:MAG: response regulator [Chloroflexi bacterium SZAS-1]|jgi:CheY-like chemotaxis protein|nr:response regulator [Chloroflexi bacterium SZAS-1]
MPSILLVEDDPVQRDFISRILQKSGYEVLFALNGTEGVRVATTSYPDLILMDALLPEMNGLEAAHQLKMQTATRHIPIIMLTAYVLIDALMAKTYGCDDFEMKPINFPALLAKISRLCSPSLTAEFGTM